MQAFLSRLARLWRRGASAPGQRPRRGQRVPSGAGRSAGAGGTRPGAAYPGDYQGIPALVYAPRPDGRPDPGEIVWTWVPFEEDHSQGKDRPVLIIGRDGAWLLGLMLTSKDHDHDPVADGRGGPQWVDIGSGPWDRRGRPSEIRIDRIIRIAPDGVRREGATLDEGRFAMVAEAVRLSR